MPVNLKAAIIVKFPIFRWKWEILHFKYLDIYWYIYLDGLFIKTRVPRQKKSA